VYANASRRAEKTYFENKSLPAGSRDACLKNGGANNIPIAMPISGSAWRDRTVAESVFMFRVEVQSGLGLTTDEHGCTQIFEAKVIEFICVYRCSSVVGF